MSEIEWYDVEIRKDGQMTGYQLDIDESGGARQPATTTVLDVSYIRESLCH